ncbi:glycosyltransferase [Ectobacillus antri]|uniref:glycosyltransferase n=1 Tax=Ectobacillus antri TaxID=2486280 RepID=UPI0013DDE77E|nr:glycosyltransferase [Ectobacillus antri]
MNLSIVLPVYNVEPYLRECLDSIFKNNLSNFEVIAINDGSTDNSLEILEEYSGKYKNMKLINQQNMGLSVTRNVGLENSSGKYVYFFDSDDILVDGMDLSSFIDDVGNIDIITFDADVFKDDISNHLQKVSNYKELYIDNTNTIFIKGIKTIKYSGIEYLNIIKTRNSYSPVVWRRIYKKEFLLENNALFYPGLIPAEDDLHFFQTLFLNPQIIHFREVVVLHRIRDTSIMSNLNRNKSYESFNIIFRELLNMRALYSDSLLKQEVTSWIINVFVRRIHSQQPTLKEAIRLWGILKENNIRIELKTFIKLFINVVRG